MFIFIRIQSSKKATFHIIFDYLEDKAIQKDKTGNPVFLITATTLLIQRISNYEVLKVIGTVMQMPRVYPVFDILKIL
jgi:hypothetical protein